jgi:ubiquinone/menaquinone biosynthesis C-methylase UbiE
MLPNLKKIQSPEELMNLSYFDFLPYLGEFSIHFGGLNTTKEVIENANVKIGEKVLEIGCGVGYTTQALIKAGAKVSVVDKSSRMIEATIRNCQMKGLPTPNYFITDAIDLSGLQNDYFNFALYENILGFVENKKLALTECKRVLTKFTSRIGIVELHYVKAPPNYLLTSLEELLELRIEPMFEKDWKLLFHNFDNTYWNTYELNEVKIPSIEESKFRIANSKLTTLLPDLNDSQVEMIIQKFASYEKVFAENRKYLKCHVGNFYTKS